MALITCKDCDKEFSSDAKRCVHCGAKKPPRKIGWLPVIFFSIVVVIIMVSASNDQKRAEQNPSEYVLGTCRNFIKKAVHNPSSVEFDSDYPSPSIVSPNVYSIILPYRAQNGFGAIRKSAAKCTVRYNNGSFYLIGLQQLGS